MALVIPPLKTPIAHPPAQPLILPPQLDPSCVLCLLPVRDNKWFDYSGHGNHGVNYGATPTSKGRNGFAWEFDGLASWLSCGSNASLNIAAAITIEVWMVSSAENNYKYFVSKDWNNAWVFYAVAGNKIGFHSTFGGVEQSFTSTGTFTQHKWSHAMVIYNGAVISFMIDGEETDSYTPSPAGDLKQTLSQLVSVGGNQGGTGGLFTGRMNVIRVYNRALSVLDGKALYEQGRVR